MIFRKRKDKPVNKTISKQSFKSDERYIPSLDNIEIFREAPKKVNETPRQYQDYVDLLWAYSNAEKRVLSLS